MSILNKLTDNVVFTIYVESDGSVQSSDFSADGYRDNDDDLFEQNTDKEVECGGFNAHNLTVLNALNDDDDFDEGIFEDEDGDRKSISSSSDDESEGKRR